MTRMLVTKPNVFGPDGEGSDHYSGESGLLPIAQRTITLGFLTE